MAIDSRPTIKKGIRIKKHRRTTMIPAAIAINGGIYVSMILLFICWIKSCGSDQSVLGSVYGNRSG